MLDQLFGAAGVVILLSWTFRRGFAETGLAPTAHGFREDTMILAALAYFAAALLLSGLLQALGVDSGSVIAGIVINNGAQLCGVAACVALIVRHAPGGLREFLLGAPPKEEKRANPLALAFAIFVAGVGICPILRDLTAWIILRIAPDYPLEEHPTLRALESGRVDGLEIAALWVGAAVIAPIAEEMFFRGLLQSSLAGLTKRTDLAIVLSAVAFGLVHMSQLHAVPALIFLGVLLGWAYARTGMLIIPIAVHAAFNLKTLLWEVIERSRLPV